MNIIFSGLVIMANLLLASCSRISKTENLPLRTNQIRDHPYNRILRLSEHYDIIAHERYYDPRGDGNCLYYALLFAIYPELKNDFSEIRRRFLNLDYFEEVDENIISLRKMRTLRIQILEILNLEKPFNNLTQKELEILVKYIRRIIYACLQKNYRENGFIPDGSTATQDLELIFVENSFGSDEYAIHFANFLNVHLRIYYASTDISLNDARIQNGVSNFETARQSAGLLPFYVYIIRVNQHFQVVV